MASRCRAGPPTTSRLPASRPAARVAYQRVLHQLVRRELRLLGELAGLGARGRGGAHRDPHPARRADRPRAAAPPRRRARGRLAGAAAGGPGATGEVARRGRRLDAPLRRGSTTCCATSRPPRGSGRSPGPRRPATPSPAPAAPWPTPSTRRPPSRSRRCCRCSSAHLADRRLDGHRPSVALPAQPARAAARARAGARGLLRRRPGPPARAGCRGRPAPAWRLHGRADLPGRRRPAARRAARRLTTLSTGRCRTRGSACARPTSRRLQFSHTHVVRSFVVVLMAAPKVFGEHVGR